jgi:hypothetical protein
MPFPNSFLAAPTWHVVGLGLSATIFSLGALAILSPTVAAPSLSVEPTTPEGHAITEKAMIFLGIRDVAAAVALLRFWYDGKTREMGTLVSAWTLVCVVDTWVAMGAKESWDSGIWTLIVGGIVMAVGGVGMIQC